MGFSPGNQLKVIRVPTEGSALASHTSVVKLKLNFLHLNECFLQQTDPGSVCKHPRLKGLKGIF